MEFKHDFLTTASPIHSLASVITSLCHPIPIPITVTANYYRDYAAKNFCYGPVSNTGCALPTTSLQQLKPRSLKLIHANCLHSIKNDPASPPPTSNSLSTNQQTSQTVSSANVSAHVWLKISSATAAEQQRNSKARSAITPAPEKILRRRVSANKKERRRTMSINGAFSELRSRIPNVPIDTKLSKIKTLRLASSYIAYLTAIVKADDANGCDVTASNNSGGFDAIIADVLRTQDDSRRRLRRSVCRTGWPQFVWAGELKNYSSGVSKNMKKRQ